MAPIVIGNFDSFTYLAYLDMDSDAKMSLNSLQSERNPLKVRRQRDRNPWPSSHESYAILVTQLRAW